MAKKYAEWFDQRKPTPSDIRRTYASKMIDLNTYSNLRPENIADAILQSAKTGKGLYIPRNFPLWDRNRTARIKGRRIPLDTHLRFYKFAPTIDLIASGATIKEIKEQELTPQKQMKKKLSDSNTRELMLSGEYRGIGYWDVRTRTHNLIPFDTFAEGQKYLDMFNSRIRIKYQFADAYASVPSFGGYAPHRIVVRTLPVTESECFVEWYMTQAECGCEDSSFKSIRAKKKEFDEFEIVFKYTNPERVWCRHTMAARLKAERMPSSDSGAKPVLVQTPKPTGLIGPWYALETRTLVGDERRARRPLKTEINLGCGMVVGYEGVEKMFDLAE